MIAKALSPMLMALACAGCLTAHAQGAPSLGAVTVSAKANSDPVEKSYRKMVRGMDLFERERASLSPAGSLRFKLLPRRAGTDIDRLTMDVVGDKTEFPVQIAPDHTFTLPRNPQALADNAQVVPDRKADTMTWRTEIRTPGLADNTRRLGDLRLECRVGMESGLVSDSRSFVGRFATALMDTPSYCDKPDPRYLFFSDKPLFGVTLVSGARREVLPLDKLYAAASIAAERNQDLSYCDCQLLLDRTYFLPLGDKSWPDDTLVQFETMEVSP